MGEKSRPKKKENGEGPQISARPVGGRRALYAKHRQCPHRKKKNAPRRHPPQASSANGQHCCAGSKASKASEMSASARTLALGSLPARGASVYSAVWDAVV